MERNIGWIGDVRGSNSVVMVEDKFRELDRSLGMNKMTESITGQCFNRENKAVMGGTQNPWSDFFPLPTCL